MNTRTATGLALAAIALMAGRALGTITISTTRTGNTFTWHVSVTATGGDSGINSVHIIGPGSGSNVGTWITPVGWSTSPTASIVTGSYIWQRTTAGNVYGSWDFGINDFGVTGTQAATTFMFDYANGTTSTIALPATPTTGNWAMVPTPAPGAATLAGLAGIVLAARRRR